MLRLDPAYPPVWSSATRLQLGGEPAAVIDAPSRWQELLLRELQRGIADDAVGAVANRLGVRESQARALIARLNGALERPAVIAPARVRLKMADSISSTDAAAVADALDAFGMLERRAPDVPDVGTPVVVVAHHVIHPHLAAALLRDDIPHLPIVFSGSRAVMGPLVRPGITACLSCVAFHRADADPTWPVVAAQLLDQPGTEIGRAFAFEAGAAAARMLSRPEWERPIGHSLTMTTDSLRRVWRAHPPHADCRCRSLEESATAVARFDPGRVTTRATASVPRA